jgi:hypothetical protein
MTGMAQEPAVIESAAPDRYQIEIIVFRYLDNADVAGAPGTGEAPPSVTEVATGEAWSPLAPSELRLGGTASRLRRPGVYQLLFHGGWTQSIAGRRNAAPTPLPAEAQSNGVHGTVTIYRERFLHAVVDLRLVESAAGLTTARLREGRRLKGQALQYFDDPAFGLILAARSAPTSPLPADPGARPESPR